MYLTFSNTLDRRQFYYCRKWFFNTPCYVDNIAEEDGFKFIHPIKYQNDNTSFEEIIISTNLKHDQTNTFCKNFKLTEGRRRMKNVNLQLGWLIIYLSDRVIKLVYKLWFTIDCNKYF